jgi:carbamoyltransferase
MKVLGISPDVWISSAALIVDGKLVAAVPEERLTRQKMTAAFPSKAIDFCLSRAGLKMKDIDEVAIAWNPGAHLRSASGRHLAAPKWRGEYLGTFPSYINRHLGDPEITGIEQVLRMGSESTKIRYVNHHECHVASSFFLSPFKEAATLTVDGRGELETCTWSHCNGNDLKKLMSIELPYSLGLFYSTITEFLGFQAHSDEWKVMALASYGEAKNQYYKKLKDLIWLKDDGRFEMDLSYFSYYLFDKQPHMFTQKLEDLLGPARKKKDDFNQRHNDIARALQEVFEETFSHMLHALHRLTGLKNLTIAGGAAMNSVYNGKIHLTTPFENVFISSCPDDSGVSVGAALYSYKKVHQQSGNFAQSHNSWGPGYSDEEIEDTLQKYKVSFTKSKDVFTETAKMLTQKQLVGWFQGQMEFGQRALGNRSIIADPRDPSAKDRINAAVKYREGFRPFAPAILAEDAPLFFEMPKGEKVNFMEKVFPVRREKRELIPAVVHEDGSGRLQTVEEDSAPEFYKLISKFKEMTNVPIIINTSFNLNGEPVVCTPTDAIRTFFSCGLDALVLGSYIIRKS